MPTTTLTAEDFTDGSINIVTLMVKGKLAASNGEARRLLTQGGVTAADAKVADHTVTFPTTAFEGDGLVVKKGKKVFHRFVIG